MVAAETKNVFFRGNEHAWPWKDSEWQDWWGLFM
jgi:hypothetical protein